MLDSAFQTRAWPPNKLTPLRSEGVVRQGNRQAGRQLAAAWRQKMRGQVHWVQQAEAWKHPAIYYRRVLPTHESGGLNGQTPAGGMDRTAKAGMVETGAANINTRSGQSIRDAVA